jgi:hypothetical protein
MLLLHHSQCLKNQQIYKNTFAFMIPKMQLAHAEQREKALVDSSRNALRRNSTQIHLFSQFPNMGLVQAEHIEKALISNSRNALRCPFYFIENLERCGNIRTLPR